MVEDRMPDFSVDFGGRTAIVTGAGSGAARATALALAAAGANVFVNDQNPDRVDTVLDAIRAAGGRAEGMQGDITNRFQAAAMIENARDVFGRIHYLVNGAGVFKAEPLLNIDEWDWRRQIEVNIVGPFFCTQLVARVMSSEGGGSILHFASTAGNPHTLAQGVGYVAGKAGLVGMVRQAARELAPVGVRVNALLLGHVAEEDMPAALTPPNALGRMGSVEEAANAALFLLSDAASFITGAAVPVDGGG
ncbi:MAG: SDR family oxidoreductase [Aggregatilineales bacterium]